MLDKFYQTIANSLLVYDFVLKPTVNIRMTNCDRFIQGTFVPKDNQVKSST
jgi:hypothetical protein